MTIPVLPVGDGPHRLSLGVRPLGDAPICVIDPDRHAAEVALRRRLLDAGRDARFAALPVTHDAQRAALALLVADVARQGALPILLGEDDAVPLDGPDPLDWAGRHLAEDLLLLDAGAEDVPLVAGSLCFPNGWSLRPALGRSIAEIHAPVPGFAEAIGAATLALMRRLRPGRPVWRANWTLRTTDALDMSPGVVLPPAPARPEDAAGVMVRVERQTLSRLPATTAVLFTIHTRSRPLGEVAADPDRARRLLDTLASMPTAMRDYKGIADLVVPVSRYLRGRLTDPS
jgi:hypothetical protein